MKNQNMAYLLCRIAIGTSLFGHGLVRMPILSGFSGWMTGQFKESMLPQAIVLPFSYILPFAELIVGLLLVSGLFTKQALITGAIVMIVLVFGSTAIQQWEAIPSQLIHIAFIAFLLTFLDQNTYVLDKRFSK
jgi:thiosulfate dehydrogenase [quinone] large subunit